MAWPRCPECGARDIHVYDCVADLAEAVEIPMRIGVVVVPPQDTVQRSFECACGCTWICEDRIKVIRPPTIRLRRKYGQPVDHSGVTSGA